MSNLIIRSGNTVKDLVNTHFCNFWFLNKFILISFFETRSNKNLIFIADGKYIFSPPEFLSPNRVSLLCSLHVFVHLGDWHEEIPLVAQDRSGQQDNEAAHCGVLKVRYLKLTWAEIDYVNSEVRKIIY